MKGSVEQTWRVAAPESGASDRLLYLRHLFAYEHADFSVLNSRSSTRFGVRPGTASLCCPRAPIRSLPSIWPAAAWPR